MNVVPTGMSVSDHVRQAVAAGEAVVALESTIVSYGLPRPRNLEVALELEEIVVKVSIRELPLALASGRHAATTVASTAYLAQRAGIRVFATGGIGGVHRGASLTFDESADGLGLRNAIVVANPIPTEHQLDPVLHERLLTEAIDAADRAGVRGQAVTPFLLDHLVNASDGASLSRLRCRYTGPQRRGLWCRQC